MARRYQIRRPNSRVARWARRIFGVIGTAVVLAVGGASARMIVPGDERAAATPEPTIAAREQRAATRAPRLTARQREERRGAVDELRRQGYVPVRLSDYRADHVLRVLIGEPAASAKRGLRAFFFVRAHYVGNDAASPSLRLRAGRQREREITLAYALYRKGDRECCPKGGELSVRFRWTGSALEPRGHVPPAYQRLPSAFART